MKSTTRHLFAQRCLIVLIVLGLTTLIAGQRLRTSAQALSQTLSAQTAPQRKGLQRQTLRGPATVEQLKKDGQYDSLQAARQQARYTVQRAVETHVQAQPPPCGEEAWLVTTKNNCQPGERKFRAVSSLPCQRKFASAICR
jgi:hypothetical protein